MIVLYTKPLEDLEKKIKKKKNSLLVTYFNQNLRGRASKDSDLVWAPLPNPDTYRSMRGGKVV